MSPRPLAAITPTLMQKPKGTRRTECRTSPPGQGHGPSQHGGEFEGVRIIVETPGGESSRVGQQGSVKAAMESFERWMDKEATPDEKKVAKVICNLVLESISIGDEEVLVALEGKHTAIQKILQMELFKDFVDPGLKCLLLSLSGEARLKDVIDSIMRQCQVEEQLDRLDAEAKGGRIPALRELAFLAHESTRRLEEWATKRPQFSSMVARDYASWPILAACKKSKLLNKIDLLKNIGLNEARPNVTLNLNVAVDPTPPQRWAVRLLSTIDGMRTVARGFPDKGFWPKAVVLDFEGRGSGKVSDRLFLRAKGLPEFSEQSAGAWWKLAQILFLKMTNNKPWEEEELKNYANSARIDPGATWKKFDGIRRSNVLRHVRKAFFELADSLK